MRNACAKMRRLLRPGLGRLRVGLRAALIVSLWHAPIPWVHFHDLKGPQVEDLDPLSRHVAEFHADDLDLGRRAVDWHAHLVLPWALDLHDPCPGEDPIPCPDDVCVIVTAEAANLQLSMSLDRPVPGPFTIAGHLPAQFALRMPEVVATATIPACGWCRHFFETYGRAAAVRDLAGVRLC